MPVRKRYYVTEQGREALVEASKRLLSSLEWYYMDLNVGLEASDLLTPGEIASCLNKRLDIVQANKKRLKEMYGNASDAVYKKKTVIKNLLYFREAEERFLRELFQEMSKNN